MCGCWNTYNEIYLVWKSDWLHQFLIIFQSSRSGGVILAKFESVTRQIAPLSSSTCSWKSNHGLVWKFLGAMMDQCVAYQNPNSILPELTSTRQEGLWNGAVLVCKSMGKLIVVNFIAQNCNIILYNSSSNVYCWYLKSYRTVYLHCWLGLAIGCTVCMYRESQSVSYEPIACMKHRA